MTVPIRNTTADMRDPANALGFLLDSLADGTPSRAIERMEADGQRQLVNSDRLPAQGMDAGGRAPFEALGFTFGNPDPADPMFMSATLPTGWSRKASDHDMWSHIVDDLGRERVAIFYKAAFYDRHAFMRLNTVIGYVRDCLWKKIPFVTDDTWATPAAVADALNECIAGLEEQIREISSFSGANDEYWQKRQREHAEEIAAIQARLDEFVAGQAVRGGDQS